jgi:hypothetical protein
MSIAQKRIRSQKTSEDHSDTKKTNGRKKGPVTDTKVDKKDIHPSSRQRFPTLHLKPYHGELRLTEDDVTQMWINIKNR